MPPKTLRIAFATPEYVTENYFDGGLANYLSLVAPALADLGHDIHVVTLSDINARQFEHEGVVVHRVKLKAGWQLLNSLTRYRFSTTVHWLNLSVEVYRKLKQLNRQKPFHLIQFPNYSYCGLVSMLLLRTPHVLRASSYGPFFHDSRMNRTVDFKLLKSLEKLQLTLSPHIYTPSRSLQQLLDHKDGLNRVRIVPKPIYLKTENCDYSIYDRFLKGRDYLLFFGRFEERKGFHILAQALARVLEDNADINAVVVGRDVKTALHPSMADYARDLCGRFGERFMVLDQLAHQQLYPVIEKAKLVVLPSVADNMPNACLEAMALGKAVVGTFESSLDEVITDEVTGFLVAPNNVEALAEKIIYAWTYPKLLEIGVAAQQKTLEYSLEKTTKALLSYYQEILQN
jgi:glycosyltransferase involved in cell wall biosynthesis